MDDSEKTDRDDEISSFKNAMISSILFVGGGIAFFWLVLFIAYDIRL